MMPKINILKTSLGRSSALLVSLLSFVAVAQAADTVSGQVFVVTKAGTSIKLALLDVKAFKESDFNKQIENTKRNVVTTRQQLAPQVKNLLAEKALNIPKREEANDAIRRANDAITAASGNDNQMKARWERQLAGYKLEEVNNNDKEIDEKYPAAVRNSILPVSSSFFLSSLKAPTSVSKSDADGNFEMSLAPGSYVFVASGERNVIRDIERYEWVVKIKVRGKTRVMLSNHNMVDSKCEECVELPSL